MNANFFFIISLLIVLSCKNESKKISDSDWVRVSERISYSENKDFFEFKSGKFKYKIPQSKLPFKKIMLLNASLTGYILEIKAEDKINGIASPEYVFSEKIRALITQKKIQNIGNDHKYNIEKILSYKPDAIFTNYIESFENTYNILRKNDIQVIFIDEYLEQKPLDKANIINLFGQLLGKEKEASLRFEEIKKEYEKLSKLAQEQKEKPKVLVNEMYGNQWFLAGGKTFTANYLKDAGANYILKENEQDTSVPMSFEEVFIRAKDAEYWVNVGNHKHKSELISINPNYEKLSVYQKGEIYSLSGAMKGAANDAFESGAIRVDLMLKDYIKIFHPHLLPHHKLIYLKPVSTGYN